MVTEQWLLLPMELLIREQTSQSLFSLQASSCPGPMQTSNSFVAHNGLLLLLLPVLPLCAAQLWALKTCQCFPRSRKPHCYTHDAMAGCLSVQGFWVSSAGSQLQAALPPSGHHVSPSLKSSKRKEVCLEIWGERDSHLWQTTFWFASGISGDAFSLWGM